MGMPFITKIMAALYFMGKVDPSRDVDVVQFLCLQGRLCMQEKVVFVQH